MVFRIDIVKDGVPCKVLIEDGLEVRVRPITEEDRERYVKIGWIKPREK